MRSAAQKKQIVDYLVDRGWPVVDEQSNWRFHDGAPVEEERLSPSLQTIHIRYDMHFC